MPLNFRQSLATLSSPIRGARPLNRGQPLVDKVASFANLYCVQILRRTRKFHGSAITSASRHSGRTDPSIFILVGDTLSINTKPTAVRLASAASVHILLKGYGTLGAEAEPDYEELKGTNLDQRGAGTFQANPIRVST